MTFVKGKSGNPDGKPNGIKHKKTQQWEMFAEYCLNGGLQRFQEELEKLKGRDFTQTFINLLEYHKPKLARNENTDELKIDNVIRVVYEDSIKASSSDSAADTEPNKEV